MADPYKPAPLIPTYRPNTTSSSPVVQRRQERFGSILARQQGRQVLDRQRQQAAVNRLDAASTIGNTQLGGRLAPADLVAQLQAEIAGGDDTSIRPPVTADNFFAPSATDNLYAVREQLEGTPDGQAILGYVNKQYQEWLENFQRTRARRGTRPYDSMAEYVADAQATPGYTEGIRGLVKQHLLEAQPRNLREEAFEDRARRVASEQSRQRSQQSWEELSLAVQQSPVDLDIIPAGTDEFGQVQWQVVPHKETEAEKRAREGRELEQRNAMTRQVAESQGMDVMETVNQDNRIELRQTPRRPDPLDMTPDQIKTADQEIASLLLDRAGADPGKAQEAEAKLQPALLRRAKADPEVRRILENDAPGTQPIYYNPTAATEDQKFFLPADGKPLTDEQIQKYGLIKVR